MGIGVAMEHKHGTTDGRERRRVSTVPLQSDHVGPRLPVRQGVDGAERWSFVLEVVTIDARAHSALHSEASIGIWLAPLNLSECGLMLPRQPRGASCFERDPRLVRERATPDENQCHDRFGPFGGVGKRQHGAPRVTDENRLSTTAASLNDGVQIANVCGYGQRFVVPASLIRLQDVPVPAQHLRQRCKIARRGGPAVHGDDRVGSDAVLPHRKIGH